MDANKSWGALTVFYKHFMSHSVTISARRCEKQLH